MSYDNNIYYSPENHGLRTVGEIEWDDESYQFNLTKVWVHSESGAIYYADDSGCSCPCPFEDYNKLEDLTKAERVQDLIDHLAERRAGREGRYGQTVAHLTELDREIAALVRATIAAKA